MKFVVKSIPNTKYLLVGGGDDIDRMKNLVEDLNLGENVIFTGPAADGDIIEYFNLADVFILPSKQEGFPAIVLLEALACGVPVIGGNQSDAEGSMFDGDVGLIVNPDSVDEIAQALVKVLSGSAQKKLYDRDFLRRCVIEQYGVERYRQYVADIVGHVSNG